MNSDTRARTTPVTTTKPNVTDMEYILSAIGTLESPHQPTVSFEISGRLENIFAEEGDEIFTGQVLAKIDDTLYQIERDKALSELKRLNLLIENQSSEVERLGILKAKNSVSQDRFEDEQANLSVLEAQQEIAKKLLEEAEYRLSKTQIVAPYESRLRHRYVSKGEYVKVGDPVFDLVSFKKLRVRTSYPEHEASNIQPGLDVRLSSPSDPERIVKGIVRKIKPVVNQTSRSFDILIDVLDTVEWSPGMTVDVELISEKVKNAMMLPAPSVVLRPTGKVIYVVKGDYVVERKVIVGQRDAELVHILGGLDINDLVVVEGASFLTNGSAVTIRNFEK